MNQCKIIAEISAYGESEHRKVKNEQFNDCTHYAG